MISYRNGGPWQLLRLRGSVFPASVLVSLPPALGCALLRWLLDEGHLDFMTDSDSILKETQVWSGFSFLVGFLIVFRTSQAYNRFWDGCTATHQMRANWFDACSALCAFCSHSSAPEEDIVKFRNTLIRLVSMLHAVALAELESVNVGGAGMAEDISAFSFSLIDAKGIDVETLRSLKSSGSKVELLFSWIQRLLVENINSGVLTIPAPMLSRSFQELGNGMIAFHDAMKISYIPFPFPYAQVCECLLVVHWLIVPFVTATWVSTPVWAAIFVVLQVLILWSLNFIAREIENPFGTDANDIDGRYMQEELNRHLLLLLQSESLRTPHLVPDARLCETMREEDLDQRSFCEVWEELDGGLAAMAARAGVDEMAFVRGGSPVGSSDILPWLTATNRNKRSPSARSSRSSKHARGSRASNCSNHSAEPPSLRTSRQSVESPLPRLSQNSMYSSGLDSLKEEEFHCSVAQINDESLEEGTVSTEANRGKAPGRGEPAPLPRLVASSNEALNRVHKDIALLPGPQVFLPKRLGTGLPRPAGDRQEEEPQDTI